MLGKLLKYDLKWMLNKVMWIYYVILIIVSISIKIVENVHQTMFLVIVDKVLVGVFISCCISVLITCFMRIWARFIQNIYKDESYLTHTLPVTKNELFNAKIISSIISVVISILVIVACVAFVYLNDATFEELRLMYDSLVQAYNGVAAVVFIIGLVLIILLEMINAMMCGIFGIVVGHRYNDSKIIKSILIGLVSYIVLASFTVIVLNVISTNLLDEVVTNGFPSINTLKVMGFTALGLYTAFIIGFYFISKKLLNKGVNVD